MAYGFQTHHSVPSGIPSLALVHVRPTRRRSWPPLAAVAVGAMRTALVAQLPSPHAAVRPASKTAAQRHRAPPGEVMWAARAYASWTRTHSSLRKIAGRRQLGGGPQTLQVSGSRGARRLDV